MGHGPVFFIDSFFQRRLTFVAQLDCNHFLEKCKKLLANLLTFMGNEVY